MNPDNVFPHQRLDIYKVAREICLRVHAAEIAHTKLRDQAERASSSMFLQLAEGLPIRGAGLRKKYFTESNASLHELVAALDVCEAARFMSSEEANAILALCARTRRMLVGLLEPRRAARTATPAEPT
jgi:four helix bundle protein